MKTSSSKLYSTSCMSFLNELAAILKMATIATMGHLHDGSTSKFIHIILIYICAKIGAFIKKCTIVQLNRSTIQEIVSGWLQPFCIFISNPQRM